jgi:hypothetical protein
MSEPESFPHTEEHLSGRFGLPRAYFRDQRKAQPEARGQKWTVKNGVVMWSAAAVEALAASLGVENGAGVSNDLPAIKTAPTPLIVAQARLSNTRLIACAAAGDDLTNRERWRLVRVRDAGRFVRGMEILAEPIEDSAMWRFLGQPGQPEGSPVRYPRGKGRW